MSQPTFDFGDDGVQLDEPLDPTYSVGELADAINAQFRRAFNDGVWVRGEINGLVQRGPHVYFSLIEHVDGARARLDVKFFAPAIKRLTPMLRKHRLDLDDGMRVRIHGHLDYWAQGGSIGLKMDGLDPRFTLGDIAQSREAVLKRLVDSGLIGVNKRRPLSPIPLRVGVATSVDSAAWADFRTAIEASGFAFHLVVADTRVQGDGADRMIAGAIGTLARGARKGYLDAIVVIRGGGARNELAVFDAEGIAHTIAASSVPVFTGLGHEIDRTIADEMAHTALTTPTACARALVDVVAAYVADTETAWNAIVQRSSAVVDRSEQRVVEVGHRIAARTRAAVDRADERIELRRNVLLDVASRALDTADQRLDASANRLLERAGLVVERAGAKLDVLSARTAAVDPAVQLARGWTITRTSQGGVVRTVADVRPGDTLTTHVADGSIVSTVDDATPELDARPSGPGGTDTRHDRNEPEPDVDDRT